MKKTNLNIKSILILGSFLAAVCFAGCNTAEGLGEDIESAGENLSDEARDANN